MITKAMLMSAGLGTRLKPFTDIKTKALIPLMGIPSAQYSISSLSSVGVNKIVANAHHDFFETKKGLLRFRNPNLDIEISDESKQLLGSAGGIQNALPLLGTGAFFLANADVLCDVDWRALESCHRRLRSRWGVEITLAVCPMGPQGGRYREILFDSDLGLITGLGDLSVQRPFYVGAAVMETEALKNVPQGSPSEFIPKILEPAIREKKAGIFLTNGIWYDMGSPLLWLKSHLSLIARLETGLFQSPIARLWRKELERVNFRRSNGVWVSRNCERSMNWKVWDSPCYWGEDIDLSRDSKVLQPGGPPSLLGPNAVLYGTGFENKPYQSGIGYGGIWMPQVLEN